MPELRNERWEAYAKLRASGHKKNDAYIAAGYKPKDRRAASNQARNLEQKNPEILARITELEDDLRNDSLRTAAINREYVLEGLRENHQKASQSKAILDREGNETGEYTFQVAGSNRALELMGKELGMFVERFSIESLDSQLESMSGEELRAFVKASACEVGLRVVEMNDAETLDWIERTARRLGYRLVEIRGAGAGGAEAPEAGGVPPVSEAEGVPPSRRH